MNLDLKGKTALITGASRGIGRAVALTFAELGADVVINYAGNLKAAQETAEAVRLFGVRSIVVQADVADSAQVDKMAKEVLQEFERIDILVNNAGIAKDNLLPRLSEQDWDTVLDTNLKGAYLCTKALLRPMLKARWGRIINISSVVGLTGNPGQSNYAASKAGLIGLTKALAKEYGSRNITVNAIAPGFIGTDMTESLSKEQQEQMLSTISLGRLGVPGDISAATAFLASDWAGYITGQVLVVDGGMTGG